MARDDFSPRTVDLLMKQVAGACSRPSCDVQTIGPAPRLAPEKLSNVGTAAHITAASPGGPRYNPSLTSEERRGPNNGIWLCAVCGRDVDTDADSYPVELLREWKASALRKAFDRHRKPFLTDAAVDDRMAAVFKACPSAHAPAAIRNAHVAADKYLGSLDPRLAVSTSFSSGVLVHQVRAKEKVDFRVAVSGADPDVVRQELTKLFDEGQAASIPTTSMKLLGSELLEELTADMAGGVLQLIPTAHPVTLRISLLEGPRRTETEIAVVEGAVTAGSKVFNLAGSLWGGLLKFSIRSAIIDGECEDSVLTFIPNFELWDGKDIRMLPSFEEARSFASKAFDGATVRLEANVQGRELFRSETDLPADGLLSMLGVALDYTHLAREFARRQQWAIQFRSKFLYNYEDHQRLADAFDIVTGARDNVTVGKRPLVVTATFGHPVEISEAADLGALRFVAGDGCSVPVFDWQIELPPPVFEVTGICRTPRRTYRAGKKIDFKFDPRMGPVSLKWSLGEDGASPVLHPRADLQPPPSEE